jgi:hypothetical protein
MFALFACKFHNNAHVIHDVNDMLIYCFYLLFQSLEDQSCMHVCWNDDGSDSQFGCHSQMHIHNAENLY